MAALSWTRFWTGTVEVQLGAEQHQTGDVEKAAATAGRVCTLAGGGLAFYLFLANPEAMPTRALGRSLVVFNISLALSALQLALRLRLAQAAVNMTSARPRGLGAIERASRLRVLFTREALPEAIEGLHCAWVRSLLHAPGRVPVPLGFAALGLRLHGASTAWQLGSWRARELTCRGNTLDCGAAMETWDEFLPKGCFAYVELGGRQGHYQVLCGPGGHEARYPDGHGP